MESLRSEKLHKCHPPHSLALLQAPSMSDLIRTWFRPAVEKPTPESLLNHPLFTAPEEHMPEAVAPIAPEIVVLYAPKGGDWRVRRGRRAAGVATKAGEVGFAVDV
jgi:hypothetical protein